MGQNRVVIKTMRPFNTFPVRRRKHFKLGWLCTDIVLSIWTNALPKFTQRKPGRAWYDFSKFVFNKLALCSRHIWWMTAWKHKRPTGIVWYAAFMMCSPAWRHSGEQLNELCLKTQKTRTKRSRGFVKQWASRVDQLDCIEIPVKQMHRSIVESVGVFVYFGRQTQALELKQLKNQRICNS